MIIAWLAPVVLLVALLFVAALLFALVLPLARIYARMFRVLHDRRVLVKPSADWWPDFEREFRKYADGSPRR